MALSPLEQMRSRFRTEWINDPKLVRHYERLDGIITVVNDLKAKRTTLADGGTLSAKGITDTVRPIAAKDVVPVLQRAHAHTEQVKANLDMRRRNLMAPKSDPKDVVGEMKRAEIRARIQPLPAHERISAVMADPAVASAYLDAPVFLSGGTADEREKIDEMLAQKIHPDALAEIDTERDAIAVVDAVVTMGLNEMRRQTDFADGDRQFDKWMESVSAPVEKELNHERVVADKATALSLLKSMDSSTRYEVVNSMFDIDLAEIEKGSTT